jgi:mono/diheme cytochrome c family protein/uncharacterized membrane protein
MNRISSLVLAIVAMAAPSSVAQPSSSSAAAAGSSLASASAPTAKGDLAQAALAIFQEKCTQCHGPDAAAPPKGFNYVIDLRKLVESGKVLPGKPADSLLYKKVSTRQMPPSWARNGGLAPEQIETISAWIAAGAPPPAGSTPIPAAATQTGGGAASSVAAPPIAPSPGGLAPNATAFQRFAWKVGQLHLLLVHFPIALLLAGLLAEVLHRIWPATERRWCARYCLWLGALGALAAGTTGWLLDSSVDWPQRQDELLDVHGVLGTSTAILATAMVVLGWVLLRKPGRRAAWLYVLGVMAAAVLVSLTGYWGGWAAWG